MPADTDTTGFGITSMRDRIEAVGGQVEIVSALDKALLYTEPFPTTNGNCLRGKAAATARRARSSSP